MSAKARSLSCAIHVLAIALLLRISYRPAIMVRPDHAVRLVNPSPATIRLMSPHSGGGGGGGRSVLPPIRGRLPKAARRQLTPPSATRHETQPILVVEPTLVLPADVPPPALAVTQLGDPFARNGPPSNGPGFNGGIGVGGDGGVGHRRGPGFGDQEGVGLTAVGGLGGMAGPTLVYKIEPEYSDEARKAKFQGTVVLSIEVDQNGKPRQFRIVHGLGLGLDEKAIEAVSRWKFRPAYRDGKAVIAPATIEVNFRLL